MKRDERKNIVSRAIIGTLIFGLTIGLCLPAFADSMEPPEGLFNFKPVSVDTIVEDNIKGQTVIDNIDNDDVVILSKYENN